MKPSTEIPRPAGSLLSHSLRFFRNTMQFYEDAYRECGDIFTTRIPGLGDWVYICSPELVRKVIEAPPDVLTGDLEGFNLFHVLGKGATSHLDGPARQERRDVISPYLDAQGSLRHVDHVRGVTERKVAEWPSGAPFPLVLETQRIALESLVGAFFGGASPERVRELADIYQDFSFKGVRSPATPHSSLQFDLGPWSPWGRVKMRQRKVLAAFNREIDARLAAVDRPEEDDIVLGMARARLADGGRIPREAILAELLDLLFQGHEMTGDGMTWILSELLANPEALARLRGEIAAVAGDGEIRSEHLSRLPYLEAAIYEGLRKRPTNFLTGSRRVKKPFELGGYLLPPGTLIAISYPALGMRDDLFPQPKRFEPERFRGHAPTDARSPFGLGPHACTGRELAMVILKTALATIVRKADLKLAQEEVRPVRHAWYYEPNQGLLVTLEGRL
jgi:cytochrome P450